ncbi:MAG: adenylate/guanylate cyclase domain-containing protein [Lachnospiraceae bacterium]|nr:adenylate/guanylate cyclase domain-containing protein [Lachnospiraceae bacterium]
MTKDFTAKIRTAAIPVILSAIIAAIAGGWQTFDSLDKRAMDSLYQQPRALPGDVIVIGIDDKALEELGPYNTWDRNIMASALEALAADPEKRPAAVAIDTLYTGTSDPQADSHLAEAAAELGNVITASYAMIGTAAVTDENGRMYYDYDHVFEYSLPYEQLRDVTVQGHINAMCDSDGILRHALLYIEPDGEKVYSMAYTAAKMYADKTGRQITEPETRRASFYLSYSSLPEGFYDGYSLTDLIHGEITPDEFAGRIVFIGPYAVGLQDTFFTAIDRREQMYGVEYQANAVQAILDGDYKHEVNTVLQQALLFVICIVFFFVFRRMGFKGSTAAAAAVIAASVGISYLLYQLGYVVRLLWIPAGVLIEYLVSVGQRYLRSVIEKQQITRTFERYVAPEIVSEILKAGPESLSLGGKLCDIAVLFVDVRGFTTMSERLEPEKVVHILNRYLTMASECVERNGGTLDKFVGDAMMAFWGAPLPDDDSAYRAVVTANDIVAGAAAVSRELVEEIGEELNVGVGVHFGPAVVGNMGAERHMDYTAIGDTVNTAARLEANAPGGTVYISRSVAEALPGRIEYTSLGNSVRLKGKSEDFEVLRLDKVL